MPTDQVALAVERSRNAKLGAVSATYTAQQSCPTSCHWYGAGCYAELGPVGMNFRRLTFHAEGLTPRDIARAEARAIDRLTGDRALRLHVAGDCRTRTAARTVGRACTRFARRGTYRPSAGRKAWTYTHSWQWIDRADWGDDVSVLASCETPEQVALAHARGYATALVVPEHTSAALATQGTLRLLPCPAQTRGVTCADCGLCRDDTRLLREGITIAFAAHGARTGTVQRKLHELQVVGE